MKTINRPVFLLTCKCERCGNTTLQVVQKDEDFKDDVFYLQLCLECFRNTQDPDYKADYCRVKKECWLEFVQANEN